MNTPDDIKKHAKDYNNKAWEQYTLYELGQWVHLLTKRSQHRSTKEKRDKDLYDAGNYLKMMSAHLEHLKQTQQKTDEGEA